jgi:ATP-dependent DNA helicase PIF1
MANTDISPPYTINTVLNYIAKYVSKEEKKSVSYKQISRQIIPYINCRALLLSFVSKILNKLVGERDWSSQEVSHILLQISTQGSTRIVVNLDCRLEEVRDLIIVEEDEVSTACSPCRKYRSRLQNVNLNKVREDTVRILQSLSLFN